MICIFIYGIQVHLICFCLNTNTIAESRKNGNNFSGSLPDCYTHLLAFEKRMCYNVRTAGFRQTFPWEQGDTVKKQVQVYCLHSTEQRVIRPTDYLLLMPLAGTACLSGMENKPVQSGTLLFLTPVCPDAVRIQSGTDLLYARIDTEFLEAMAGKPHCPSAITIAEDCLQPAERLAELFSIQYGQKTASSLEEHIAACQLLQALTDAIASELFEPMQKGDGRNAQMLSWLEQNFRNPIQLQDFADAFCLSRQHASYTFHRETGMHFSEYLQNLRLAEAEHLLTSTDKNLTQIAAESGFPNSTAMYTAFTRSCGMTPKVWKEQNQKTDFSVPAEPQDLLLAERLLQDYRMLYPRQETAVHISEEASVKEAAAVDPIWVDILNVDSSSECLRSSAQAQLMEIQNQMHFHYVRMGNPISHELIEFFPNTRHYRFTNFLRLVDFFKSVGLTPMPAFGTSWIATLNATIFSEGGFSTDLESWLQILRELLEASIHHWGADWVRTWRFEFYMPSVLYGSAAADDFMKLFEASLRLIKEMLPGASVGGPALALDQASLPRWRAWMQAVSERQLPVDFVSMELWADAVTQSEFLPGQFGDLLETRSVSTLQCADASLAVQKVRQIRDRMADAGLTDTALYVSALGIVRYQATAAQTGGHCAAWLVKCNLDLQELVDGTGCWKALNGEAEYADAYSFLSTGCGLLDRNGLHYPAWYAYQFLSSQYRELVFRGINCIVTADGYGHFAVLLHNCKNYSALFCKNFSAPAALDFTSSRLYTSYSTLIEQLVLHDIPPQKYRISRYLTGDHHGCLAWVIQQTGPVDYRSPDIIPYLAGQSLPYRHTYLQNSDGTISLQISLQPNEVMLILLDPEDEYQATSE